MKGMNPLTRKELLSCMELGKAITAELDPQNLFEKILHKISELLPAENWSLLLLDENTGELSFKLSVNLNLEMLRDIRLAPGEGIAGQVAIQKRPMMVRDVRKCPFFSDRVDRITGFRTKSIICVPLIFGNRSLGVLEVVNPKRTGDGALSLLTVIAEYAAIAVENTRRYCEIEDLAIKDPLTGLYNTRYLYQALEQLIEETRERGGYFSLIFMDLDDFKQVVDTYGHLNGSHALREFAITIRESLPEEAFGVSYGGDEFVVVLPGYDKEKAVKEAEGIRSRMSRTTYLSSKGLRITLKASFGVATYPDDASDSTGLLALADRAMFNVKKRGKDAVGSGES